MNLLNVLREGSCKIDLKVKDKDSCIREISKIFASIIPKLSEQEIYKALLDREKLGSTGFTDGIAIPHARYKGLKSFYVCIACSKNGIDFKSLDKKKTKIFFAIAGPEKKDKEYLKLLAQISRIARNKKVFRELLNSSSSEVLRETFLRYSNIGLDKAPDKGKMKLLILILSEMRYFDDLINLFLERGIKNTSIIDSSSISNYMTNKPLFSGFLNFLGERSGINRTFLIPVWENDMPSLLDDIEETTGSMDTHSGLLSMILDISSIKGSIEE